MVEVKKQGKLILRDETKVGLVTEQAIVIENELREAGLDQEDIDIVADTLKVINRAYYL